MTTVTLNDDVWWVLIGLALVVPLAAFMLGWYARDRGEGSAIHAIGMAASFAMGVAGVVGAAMVLVGLGHGFYVGVS